jgi:hypothetical protein
MRNYCIFLFILAVLQSADTCFASSQALEAMADANNARMREIQAAGPNVTGAQVDAISRRNFSGPLQMLNQEHAAKMTDWRSRISNVFRLTEEQIKKMFKRGAGGPAQPAAQTAPVAPVPTRQGRGVETNTGTAEGSSGAKGVGYGGAIQKRQPTVVDGIIMER